MTFDKSLLQKKKPKTTKKKHNVMMLKATKQKL